MVDIEMHSIPTACRANAETMKAGPDITVPIATITSAVLAKNLTEVSVP